MPAYLDYRFMRHENLFFLGFEVGQFWAFCERCQRGESFEFFYHTENEGEILRVANHFGIIRPSWAVDGNSHHARFFR